MPLRFELTPPVGPASPNRADVACFIGFVARRKSAPLPFGVRDELLLGPSWAQGPWRLLHTDTRDERRRKLERLEKLENVPVPVDSWDAFDSLFAWNERPLEEIPNGESGATCATYLGAAVRSFFASGGKRAVIVRVGDPWPFLEPSERRTVRRGDRLADLVPDLDDRGTPFHPADPGSWRGVYHLYGLPEVSLLCLPDLPDACALEPLALATAVRPPPLPEGFVECSAAEPVAQEDQGLRRIPAPRLDSLGFAPWRKAIAHVRDFLDRHQREVVLLAAVPLPHPEASRDAGDDRVHAEADMLEFLLRADVLDANDQGDRFGETPPSAFVQMAYPWLRTRAAADLPEGAEPPDGLLAGLMAANALTRGTFRSVAGAFSLPRLSDVRGTVPPMSWGAGPDSPPAKLAERVCVFAPTPDGIGLQSDVTTSRNPAWRFGGTRRLMGVLLRAARRTGEWVLFDGNGPATWNRISRAIEELLEAFWQRGAFGGRTPAEAYSVRCDRSTMTQHALDHGRVVAEIRVRPAASIEDLTVVLKLAGTGADAVGLREVA